MKKFIRSTFKAVLILTAMASFILMTAEASTPGMQFICTTGAMAVLLLSTNILDKMGAFDEEDR